MTAAPRTMTSANAVLSALLEARTGQQVGSERLWRIDSALQPLLRDRGESLDLLVMALLGGGDPGLGDRIVELLLNNETSFFREPAVFANLVEALAATSSGAGSRLRLWSAGCSTGQEPLSLAMALADRFGDDGRPVPEIVATDVSDAALARARVGRFTQFEIQRGLPARQMVRWFEANGDGDWVASPALMRSIAYRRLNLARMPWSVGRFDAILCRNVLLYLTPAVKRAILDGFASALRPGGLLILGASETVLGQTDAFQPSRTLRGAYEPITARERAAA